MSRDRVVRLLLYAALAVLVAGALFSAAASVIWLEHWPSWAARASAAGLAAGVLLAASGASLWVTRSRPGVTVMTLTAPRNPLAAGGAMSQDRLRAVLAAAAETARSHPDWRDGDELVIILADADSTVQHSWGFTGSGLVDCLEFLAAKLRQAGEGR